MFEQCWYVAGECRDCCVDAVVEFSLLLSVVFHLFLSRMSSFLNLRYFLFIRKRFLSVMVGVRERLMSAAVYSLEEGEVFDLVKSSRQGLTSRDAHNRLDVFGKNVLEEKHPVSALKVFLSQFSSPVVWVLFIAAVISALLG